MIESRVTVPPNKIRRQAFYRESFGRWGGVGDFAEDFASTKGVVWKDKESGSSSLLVEATVDGVFVEGGDEEVGRLTVFCAPNLRDGIFGIPIGIFAGSGRARKILLRGFDIFRETGRHARRFDDSTGEFLGANVFHIVGAVGVSNDLFRFFE